MSGNSIFSPVTLPYRLAGLATLWLASACTPAEQPAPGAEPAQVEAKPGADPEVKPGVKLDTKTDVPPATPDASKPEADLSGVEACATYIKLYRACAMNEEVPTSERKQLLVALENQTRTWKQALVDRGKSEVVAGECRAAQTAAQVATQDFNCTWE